MFLIIKAILDSILFIGTGTVGKLTVHTLPTVVSLFSISSQFL